MVQNGQKWLKMVKTVRKAVKIEREKLLNTDTNR